MRYIDLSRSADGTMTTEYRLAVAETDKDMTRLHGHAPDTNGTPAVALLMRVTLHHPEGDRLLSRPILDGWGVRAVATTVYGAMVMDRAFLDADSLHPWHMAYSQRAHDWLHWHDALRDIERRQKDLHPQYVRQYQAALKNHRLYKATANGTADNDRARAVRAPIFSEFREERDILRQDGMAVSASLLQARERLDAMATLSIDDDLSGSQNVDNEGKGESHDENRPIWTFWLVVSFVITIIALIMLANDIEVEGSAYLSMMSTFWFVVCVKMLHKTAVVRREEGGENDEREYN